MDIPRCYLLAEERGEIGRAADRELPWSIKIQTAFRRGRRQRGGREEAEEEGGEAERQTFELLTTETSTLSATASSPISYVNITHTQNVHINCHPAAPKKKEADEGGELSDTHTHTLL